MLPNSTLPLLDKGTTVYIAAIIEDVNLHYDGKGADYALSVGYGAASVRINHEGLRLAMNQCDKGSGAQPPINCRVRKVAKKNTIQKKILELLQELTDLE